MLIQAIFNILILIMSVVIHEVSHGYVALLNGDPTAKLSKRLSLNPIKHLDIIGSFFVPLLTFFAGFPFGWAKPVPVNPYNFKNWRKGQFWVSFAGPFSNILIAIIFSLIFRAIIHFNLDSSLFANSFLAISQYIIFINIVLAVFNLMPIPPLDGSKILFSIIPNRFMYIAELLERYSLVLALFAILFVWQLIVPVIPFLFKLLTGLQS